MASNSEIEESEIDLLHMFRLLFARKWMIIFFTALFALMGGIFALLSTPVFHADALVQLEEKSGGGIPVSAELSSLFSDTPQSATEVELLRSRMILGQVVENLRLDRTAEPKRLPIIGNFLSRFDIPDPGWKFVSSYAWHDETILIQRLEIPSTLFDTPITLTAQDVGAYSIEVNGRTLNGKIGETLSDEQSGFAILVDSLEAETGREFLLTQITTGDALQSLREELSISELGKNSSILRLVLAGEDRDHITKILDQITQVYFLQNLSRNAAEAESSLTFIREQLPESEKRVQLAEEALNAFKLSQDSVDLNFETRSLLEQAIRVEAQLNELTLEEQELQKRFTQSHPSYQTLLDSRIQLQAQLADIRAQTVGLPETQQDMLRLSQDLEVAQQVYLQLLNRAQELNVIKAGTIGNIRIIDPAFAEPDAVSPNTKVIILLFAIIGLIVSVVVALLQAFVARGVQSTDQIEQLGIAVYATIPKVGDGAYSKESQKGKSLKILAKEEPTNLAVEALRSLRTSLHFGMLEAKSSLLLITSSRPTDGKSFLSVNLATVMAQAGQNICLVDIDIRRGYLRRFFSIGKSAPGLTDVLAGDVKIEDVIQIDPDSGLHFIPAGRYPPNPSELLMHERFGEVVEYLDERFDLSIFDAPPLLAVTDPIIVAKYVGMTLLVARHQITSISEIEASKKVMENNNLKITGAILNVYTPRNDRATASMSYQYEYKSREN